MPMSIGKKLLFSCLVLFWGLDEARQPSWRSLVLKVSRFSASDLGGREGETAGIQRQRLTYMREGGRGGERKKEKGGYF